MISKMLAHIGYGGTTIQTLLDNEATDLGGTLCGRMIIQAGAVDQEVTGIAAELVTEVKIEGSDTRVRENRCIANYRLADRIALRAGEQRDLPFAIDLPLHTPVALGRKCAPVWLHTLLDLPLAVDAADEDPLIINPAPVQIDTLNAMREIGYELVKSDAEYRPHWGGPHGFVQEFEFRPAHGTDSLPHPEVELVFQPDGDGGFALLMQLDRAAKNISDTMVQGTGTGDDWQRIPLPGKLQGPGQRAIVHLLTPLLIDER